MRTSVYDLAIEVVLYLVAFQRRVEDGEPVSYEDTRAEVIALLGELDRRSHTEPGLWDSWTKARIPLVFLIDEVMILNCPWDYRNQWADECLEVVLLGHPTALGGENFYQVCDEAIKDLETAERNNRQDVDECADILAVFYVALQTGFKGRYALDLDAWREYKSHVFAKLPAYAQTRSKQLFPEAEQHTVILDPNYEPVMRLLYVVLVFLFVISLYFVSTYGYWSSATSEMSDIADRMQVEASDIAPLKTSDESAEDKDESTDEDADVTPA